MLEPTTEQWRDLHEAFRDFCQATPWDWLDDSDVLAVEHPSGEYRGYCIVMGSGGLAYGLAVYIGDAGLAGYLTLMTGEVDPESLDALDHTNALSAMLADREHLETKDRATIRELGLKYRGRGRWPLFRRTIPGYLPWHLDADEAVFLTMALRNVMDMASKAASGETVLHSESGPSLVLTRVFRGGAWQDQWEPFELPQPPAPVPYPDAERLQRLAQSKSKGPEVWELAFFYLPTPMQEEKGERPYLPMMALVVDRDSSLVLSTEILGAGPSATERQDMLVRLLETVNLLPVEIVVDLTATADLAESITEGLGIKLSVGATPTLDEVKESMMAFISS
jgi:hypothetical protein